MRALKVIYTNISKYKKMKGWGKLLLEYLKIKYIYKMKVVSHVNSTNDYSIFDAIEGNRVVNQLHVERLKTSFAKSYLMSPILVNDKYQIIDGQHRFNAAKALNLPIHFIVANGYGLREVQTLNTNMKNWKKEDYLHAYCDLGYEEYLKMKQFMQDFPDFGIAVAEQLLTNTVNGTNNRGTIKIQGKTRGVLRHFQEGELRIPDLLLAYDNAEKIMMFKPYYDGFNRNVFVASMIGMFKHQNYNHSQMIQKVKNNPTALTHCSNVTQYKILIEEIYNFRSREKVSLRF